MKTDNEIMTINKANIITDNITVKEAICIIKQNITRNKVSVYVSKEKPWLYCNIKNNPTLANLQLMPPDITVGEAKQRYIMLNE